MPYQAYCTSLGITLGLIYFYTGPSSARPNRTILPNQAAFWLVLSACGVVTAVFDLSGFGKELPSITLLWLDLNTILFEGAILGVPLLAGTLYFLQRRLELGAIPGGELLIGIGGPLLLCLWAFLALTAPMYCMCEMVE
jgi:hypothetical protein